MLKIGITTGSFNPFHKGHELMLKTMFSMVDKNLIILSSKNKNEQQNFMDVIEFGISNVSAYDFKVLIIDHENEPEYETNSDGTIITPEWWNWWMNKIEEKIKKLDLDWYSYIFPSRFYGKNDIMQFVFSSEPYGKIFAEKMNARWYPVDIQREMIPVSSTMIRENIHENYHFLNDNVKKKYCKIFHIVGPESTGKTTLVKELANEFDAEKVMEFGRFVYEGLNGRTMDTIDFINVMKGQNRWIYDAIIRSKNGIVFSDTETFTTSLYHFHFHGKMIYNEPLLGVNHKQITYLLLKPTVPFVQDGTRTMNQEDRMKFHEEMKKFLMKNNYNFIEYEGEDFAERNKKIKEDVRKINYDRFRY